MKGFLSFTSLTIFLLMSLTRFSHWNFKLLMPWPRVPNPFLNWSLRIMTVQFGFRPLMKVGWSLITKLMNQTRRR